MEEKMQRIFADVGLNKTIDQLATVNSIRYCGHVLGREDDHASIEALEFVV